MIIEQFEASRVVFHYNKKHNEDQSIPPWVLKVKGQSFYVNHVEVSPGIGFSTRETPDNPHTKATLLFNGACTIKQNNNEEIVAYIHKPEDLIIDE